MSAIFDSYNNIKPNNMHEFCQLDRHDDIVVGGTAVHVFHVNFNLFDSCKEFEIVYTKGLSKLFVFSSLDGTKALDYSDGHNIFVKLSPEHTSQFDPHMVTFAQAKFVLNDGTVLYGERNKVNIVSTLEYSLTDRTNTDADSINTGDFASKADLRKEISRATAAEANLQSQVDSHAARLTDLENRPAQNITKVSELENDAGYLTEHQDISGKADRAELEGYQEKLSDTNIKTINGESILGAGNISTKLADSYIERDSIKLDACDESGIYKLTNVLDNPQGSANSGYLIVNKLADERIEQKWMSDTNQAYRVMRKTSQPEDEFYVNDELTAKTDNEVQIASGGVYTLSGKLTGSVRIKDSGKLDYTTINLRNVDIRSSGTYAIHNEAETVLIVNILPETNNTLTVKGISGKLSSDAALSSEDKIFVCGTGALGLFNNIGHGIKGSTVEFSGKPNIYIDAAHDGVHASSTIRIAEGAYYIKNAKDAFGAGRDPKPEKEGHHGEIYISGGNITIEKCAENAFQAKDAVEAGSNVSAYISVYGNTVLTLKDSFSAMEPFNADTGMVDLYNMATFRYPEGTHMPAIKDMATCYGPAKITSSSGSVIVPAGTLYTLPTPSETYTLTGDFSNYKIKVTGKSVNLRFDGVYYKNENESDTDPFIQYTTEGKRLELKLVDRKLNYIYKQAGVCLSSNKNLVINDADQSADLYLSCPNGYGISAVGGDVRVLNDGGRYITNCKVGIYTNLLSVGDDQEEPDYTKKKNTYLYVTGNEVDVKLKSRISAKTGANVPGRVVVTPNDYGCALIGTAVNETEADQASVLLEARTDIVTPEIGVSFSRRPIAYYRATDLATKDFINYRTFNEYQIPDNLTEDANA